MKAIFRKTLTGFWPDDENAQKMAKRVKIGDFIEVEIKQPRNIHHHRKFWKLIQMVYENQDHYQSADDVCTAFKFAIGHTRKIRTRYGEIEIPESISFASMDQHGFENFYDKAIDFLIADVIPGLDRADLEREITEVLA